MSAPNIKLFKMCSGYYFYDVNKNEIIKIKKKEYEEIKLLCKYPEYNNESEIINELKQNGYLSSYRVERINNYYTKYIKDYLNNKLNFVILQVTQNCNFKCRYCVYSDDGYYDRKRNSKKMSWEVAKKSIDFVKENSQYSNNISFSFYGGEPLIEYKLIKDCVNYIKKNFFNKNIQFLLTTNGYLFDEEIINFFVENKIYLTFSLDGPQNIHDKNRRLLATGEGTYFKVFENLNKIKKKNLDYFNNYVSINAVWDLEESYETIAKYFMENPDINNLSFKIDVVNSGRLNDIFSITSDNFEIQQYTIFNAFSKYFNFKKGNITKVEQRFLEDYFEFIEKFNPEPYLPKEYHPNGPCLPGFHRLYININGDFMPCEKISEKTKVLKIGDINRGFNYENIEKLFNIAKTTEYKCKNCWALRLCSVCALYSDNFEELSNSSRLEKCSAEKRKIINLLKEYIIIKELQKV